LYTEKAIAHTDANSGSCCRAFVKNLVNAVARVASVLQITRLDINNSSGGGSRHPGGGAPGKVRRKLVEADRDQNLWLWKLFLKEEEGWVEAAAIGRYLGNGDRNCRGWRQTLMTMTNSTMTKTENGGTEVTAYKRTALAGHRWMMIAAMSRPR
jgi:hypothetical protein